jgi:hypothetical protein
MDEKFFYEACHWTGSKPDLQHLWIFGCLAYEHVLKKLWKKLDPKSNKCIFIGYGQVERVRGYWLYNRTTKKVSISWSFTFDEDLFFHLEGEQTWKAFQLHLEHYHNLSTMKVIIIMWNYSSASIIDSKPNNVCFC